MRQAGFVSCRLSKISVLKQLVEMISKFYENVSDSKSKYAVDGLKSSNKSIAGGEHEIQTADSGR
jgi:hypothetical protein